MLTAAPTSDALRRMLGDLSPTGEWDNLASGLPSTPFDRNLRSAQRRTGIARDDESGRVVPTFTPGPTANERHGANVASARQRLGNFREARASQDQRRADVLGRMTGADAAELWEAEQLLNREGPTGAGTGFHNMRVGFSPEAAAARGADETDIVRMQNTQWQNKQRRAGEKTERKEKKRERFERNQASNDKISAFQRMTAGLGDQAQAAFAEGQWKGPAMEAEQANNREMALARIKADVDTARMQTEAAGVQWNAEMEQRAQQFAIQQEQQRQQAEAAVADRALKEKELGIQERVGTANAAALMTPETMKEARRQGLFGGMGSPLMGGIGTALPEGTSFAGRMSGIGDILPQIEGVNWSQNDPHSERHWIDGITSQTLAAMTPEQLAAMATPEQLQEIDDASEYWNINPLNWDINGHNTPAERKWLNRQQMAREIRRRIEAGI